MSQVSALRLSSVVEGCGGGKHEGHEGTQRKNLESFVFLCVLGV